MTFEVGDYRSTELIGAGGSAQVWRGLRISTGAAVAIKVYPADQLAAARREAALAATVNHPHVVEVLDVVSDADRVALITEYAAGGDLADLLASRGSLSAGETLTVLLPLSAALATAHERQIVHGDVSAGNVVFDRAGRPLLADLGAGRAAVESGLPVAATPADAAPELARGGPPTPATDMFSLGSLALACLTGRHAWPADDLSDVVIQAAAGQWPDPGDVGSSGLAAAVRALLDHDPGRRPGAASLVLDLRAAGRPEPLGIGPVGRHGSAALARGHRARAITRVRADAVVQEVSQPGHRRPATGSRGQRPTRTGDPTRRPGRAVRLVGLALTCLVVAALATAGGLWWAKWDRAEPIASGGLGASVSSSSPVSSGAVSSSSVSSSPVSSSPVAVAATTGSPVRTTSDRPPANSSSAPRPHPTLPGRAVRTSAATAKVSPSAEPIDWTATVRALDDARSRALVARDVGLLDEVYTAASPARAADAKTITVLLAGGLRVAGAHHVVRKTRALPGSPTRVVVDDSLPSYPVLDGSGKIVGSTIARASGHRTLVLIPTASGYRISEVR